MGEDASLHFYAALAHPNPVIPNMRVARNSTERGMRRFTKHVQERDLQLNVDMEVDALQFAYSMGGMSIKAYQMDVTNPAFDEDAADSTVTEIALGLAF